MLQVVIPESEFFDESTGEFVTIKAQTLQLEHSLVSLQKWESKWNKPFLKNDQKSNEECIDYIRCMTLTQHVNPLVYYNIPNSVFAQINAYIEAPMTATWFSESKKEKASRETITAEIIYYWMITLGIPSEYRKWHINQLLTLIRVCEIKNSPPKKRKGKDLYKHNSALNEARKKQLNTRG